MLIFIKWDGLPYLYSSDGLFYAVRWDEKGFTVGNPVTLVFPSGYEPETFSELSIKAQCAGNLDSIGTAEQEPETELEQEPETELEQEPETNPKKTGRRKKAADQGE